MSPETHIMLALGGRDKILEYCASLAQLLPPEKNDISIPEDLYAQVAGDSPYPGIYFTIDVKATPTPVLIVSRWGPAPPTSTRLVRVWKRVQ